MNNNRFDDMIKKYKEKMINLSKLSTNTKTGLLKVQVTTAHEAIPIKDAQVVISKKTNNETEILYDLKTDVDGIVDNIVLYTKKNNSIPSESPYITYDVTVTHPNFLPVSSSNVEIVENQKSILLVKMIPSSENSNDR